MSNKYLHQQFRNANRRTIIDPPDIRRPREQDANAPGFCFTVEAAMEEAVQETAERSWREFMACNPQDNSWPYTTGDKRTSRNSVIGSRASIKGQPFKMSVSFTPAPGPPTPPRSSLRYAAPGVYIGKEEYADMIGNQQSDPERDARRRRDRINMIKCYGIHQARLQLEAERAREKQAEEALASQQSDSEDGEVSASALQGSALTYVRDKNAKDQLLMLMQLQGEAAELDSKKLLDRPTSAASTAIASTRPGSAVLRPTSAVSYADSASRPNSARTLPARPQSATLLSAETGLAGTKPERRATHCSSFGSHELVPEQETLLPSPPIGAPPERRRPQTARARIADEATVETLKHSSEIAQRIDSVSQELNMESLKVWYDAIDIDRKGYITRQQLVSAVNSHQALFNLFCRRSLWDHREFVDLSDTQLVGGLRAGESFATGMLRQSLEKSQGHRMDEWSSDGWATMNRINEYRFEVDDCNKEQLARQALALRESMDILDQTHMDSLRRNADKDDDPPVNQKCYRITLETMICYFQHQGLLAKHCGDGPYNTQSREQRIYDTTADIEQDPSMAPDGSLSLEEVPSQGRVAEFETLEHGREDEAGTIAIPVAPSSSFVDQTENSDIDMAASHALAVEVANSLEKIPRAIDGEAYDLPDFLFEPVTDEETDHDVPGLYTLVKDAVVSPELDMLNPDDDEIVDELVEGDQVRVVEVVELVQQQRLRARLQNPDGWMTLLNKQSGTRFAEKQRASHLEAEDGPGAYIIQRPAFVSPEISNCNPDDGEIVDELEVGCEIFIEEVVDLADAQRRRARIANPHGWITLLNHANGKRWAVKSVRKIATGNQEDAPGVYMLDRVAFVSPVMDNFDPDDEDILDELEEGQEVRIAEVVELVHKQRGQRVRARLEEPNGWITLVNRETGKRWATPVPVVALTSGAEHSEHITKSPQDSPGTYTLTRVAFVSPDLENLDPDDEELLAELCEGEQIKVLELIDLVDQGRLRAKLEQPNGWITLLNKQTGARWAVKDELQPVGKPEFTSARPCGNNQDTPGYYVLTKSALVSPELNNLSPDDEDLIAELAEGEKVEILEIVDLQEGGCVQAESVEDQQVQITEPSQQESVPGPYILTRAACVSTELDILEPNGIELVTELPEGSIIDVSEIVELVPEKQLRARLDNPAGWITLVDKASGKRSAETWVDLSPSRKQWAEPWTGFSSSSNHEQRRMLLSTTLHCQAEALPGLSQEELSSPRVDRREVKMYLKHLFRNLVHKGKRAAMVDATYTDDLVHGDAVRLDADGVDCPGYYIVTRATSVSPALDLLYPNDDVIVDELDEGREIRVVEVVDLGGHALVRAKLDHPQGWITLANTETGRRWADRFQSFKLEPQLPEQDDEEGLYLLMHPVPVALELEQVQPEPEEIVAELDAGQEVWITEAVNYIQKNRVRAHVEQPDGWITLVNTATGWRSARKQRDDSGEPADMKLVEACESNQSWHSAASCHGNTDGERLLLDPVQNSDMGDPKARIQRPEETAASEAPCIDRVMTPTFGFEVCPQPPLDEPQAMPDAYRTGKYLLLQAVFVSPESDNFSPDDEDLIAELPEDTEVRVIEVLYFEEAARVRALLHEPRGSCRQRATISIQMMKI
eukprot:TRINITY_DN1548_c0_g1_i6.p1 TRINITY_DN1548_c0_g1~~TRINITY_DN1548_c0_g1_i6.p1  ORF type:complete len:1630 (-),score=327.65 TRINITY_DN1548_c0_g1_i6:278-5167(-)